MSRTQSYDVIVVGGGVTGCAIARELAPDHDVLVVDDGEIGGKASGMAAGLTAPTLFEYEHPDVARHANEYLREFSGTEGFEYNPRPRMELVSPEDEAAARARAEKMAAGGFPVSFVSAERLEADYPLFDLAAFAGAVEIGDAGYVDDTYVYTKAHARDATAHGAAVEPHVTVTDVVVSDGQVTGVETTDGTFDAPYVVVAAGWYAKDLLADVVHLPIRPFLLQAVTIELEDDVPADFPLGRVAAESVYFRPQNDGRLRLGGGEYLIDEVPPNVNGIEDAADVERRMAETGRTAQEVVNNGVDAEFRERAVRVAPLFVRGLSDPSDVDVTAAWSGVDAATADGEPILDEPASAPDGLVVATGLNGLGVTKSPISATAVRSLVTGEDAPFDLDLFALDRLPADLDFALQDTFAMGRD